MKQSKEEEMLLSTTNMELFFVLSKSEPFSQVKGIRHLMCQLKNNRNTRKPDETIWRTHGPTKLQLIMLFES